MSSRMTGGNIVLLYRVLNLIFQIYLPLVKFWKVAFLDTKLTKFSLIILEQLREQGLSFE